MDSYESKILDHLGLVAGMCDELELAEQIDRHIAQDLEQRKVSVGQAVKAMVLNGLDFVNQRLYLTELFFDSKPTERLLGEGIKPEHLNDAIVSQRRRHLWAGTLQEWIEPRQHGPSTDAFRVSIKSFSPSSHGDGCNRISPCRDRPCSA